MKQHTLIISLIVLTLTMSGVVGWYLLFSSPETSSYGLGRAEIGLAAQDEETDQPLPRLKENRLIGPVPISRGGAVSAIATGKNSIWYYDPTNGTVTSVDYRGSNEEVVSANKLPGFIRTVWAPSRRQVISEFATSQGHTFRYFNYDTKQSVSLGQLAAAPVFSPDSSRIAYFKRTSEGDSGIYVATPDNSEAKQILKARFSKVLLSWPSEKIIGVHVVNEQGLSSLFTLSPEGHLTKLIDGVGHLEVSWNPHGSQAVVSFFDASGQLTTSIFNVQTLGQKVIDLEARASQCAWTLDSATIACASSQTPFGPTAIENQTKTLQDLYLVSVNDGSKKLLFASGGKNPKTYISEIFFTPTASYLIFINAFDQKLYSLPIN